MANEPQKVPVGYIERAVAQAEVVEKLAKAQKDAPSAAAMAQLEIEAEKLAFYENAAQGDPKSRAKAVVESVRATLLGRAVTQPLSPLQ